MNSTNPTAAKIQIGRRVRYSAGYGGIGGDGLIVAVHGTPNPEPAIPRGVMRVLRANDCRVDVILFDGRRLLGIAQCSLDGIGIGVKLLDETADQVEVEALFAKAAQKVADDALAAVIAMQKRDAAEAARVIDGDAPVFFWNGIKDQRGAKLQKCWYSEMDQGGSVSGRYPEGTITISARDYCRFSDKVRTCFLVENDTDTQVDYFANDRIRVLPSHPLYAQVKAASDAAIARVHKRRA